MRCDVWPAAQWLNFANQNTFVFKLHSLLFLFGTTCLLSQSDIAWWPTPVASHCKLCPESQMPTAYCGKTAMCNRRRPPGDIAISKITMLRSRAAASLWLTPPSFQKLLFSAYDTDIPDDISYPCRVVAGVNHTEITVAVSKTFPPTFMDAVSAATQALTVVR